MEIKIYNYEGKAKTVEIPDETRGISVEIITGDEIITAIGDGEILDRIDSAWVFNNPRTGNFPDGDYQLKVGGPEWDAWMKRTGSYDYDWMDAGDS